MGRAICKAIYYEICDKCNGKGFRRKLFLFRKQPCIYCNGMGEIRLPDFIADVAFSPEVLAAKAEMEREGFRTPRTLIRLEKGD